MLKFKTSSRGCNQKSALEKLISCTNKHNPDIVLGPEWLFYSGTPYTREEKEDITLKIIENTSKEILILPGTFIWTEEDNLYNSVPIIFNKKIIGEYFKHEEGGEREIANEHECEFKEGEESGKVFNWKGLSIGLEICADHAMHSLKDAGAKDLDLQIILGCGMKINEKNTVIKEKGYALCCDGNKKHPIYKSEIKIRLNNQFSEIKPKLLPWRMKIYTLFPQ